MDFLATVSETMYLWYPMRQMFGLCARIIASCSSITWAGLLYVMDPTKDDQVVEEIDNGDNDRSLLDIL